MTTTLDASTSTAAEIRPAGTGIVGLGRLVATELRLVLREPVVLTFVFAFPVLTVLVLGGVFDENDPAFEGVDPAHWYAAAYIGVVIAAIGLIMMPVHLAGYRERGVLRRFQVSAFPRWALPAAQILVGLVMTGVGIAMMLVASWASYGLPRVHDLPATIVGVALGSAAFISIGVALGSLLPSARSAQGIGLLLFFPFFLLGGGGPPPDAMGSLMKSISSWIPLTHAIRAVQEPWLDTGDPANHYLVLLGLLVASTLTWVALSRRNTD